MIFVFGMIPASHRIQLETIQNHHPLLASPEYDSLYNLSPLTAPLISKSMLILLQNMNFIIQLLEILEDCIVFLN